MPRVERPAIGAHVGAETVLLFEALGTVVACVAQRLQRTRPELLNITTMRDDVISDRGGHHLPALQMHGTERMFLELALGFAAPALR